MKHEYLPWLYLLFVISGICLFEFVRWYKGNKRAIAIKQQEQEVFDSIVEEYKINDYIITIAASEFNRSTTKPEAHYHGTLLGVDNGKRELHVALYGMGMIALTGEELKGSGRGKYFATQRNNYYEYKWLALPINKVLSNETLRERQGKTSYRHLVETIDY